MTDTAEAEATPGLSPQQIKHMIWLFILSFLLLSTYGISSPGTRALFNDVHGADALPDATLLTVVLMALCVAAYNRLAGNQPLVKLFAFVCLASAASQVVLMVGHQAGVPYAAFVLFSWKEIYMVMLVEIFWSYANLTFPQGTAKWVYGFFLLMGSIGTSTASGLQSLVVEDVGTFNLLWTVPVVLVLCAAICLYLPRLTGQPTLKAPPKDQPSLTAGLSVVARNPYLMLFVGLIATTQIVITLIDFQYNEFLAAAYPDIDEQNRVGSQIYFAINVSAGVLNLAAGLVVKLFGVPKILLGIPVMLGATLAAFAVSGGFLMMGITKVASKAFDYSLFRVAKETLYMPLTYEEQTQGKAVVDMLTYRAAKGGASILKKVIPVAAATPVLFGLLALWTGLIVMILRRKSATPAAEQDATSEP